MTNQPTSPEDFNIVLTEGISDSAVASLTKSGYTSITRLPHAPDETELIELLKNTHLLGIRSRTQITDVISKNADKLYAIGCFCIGTNQVDLKSCAYKGIPVFNAPFSNTRSVAELTVASAMMLMRGIPEKNYAAHKGIWKKSALGSHEIRGKNLGIVGYGNIGSQLSVLASALGMHVYYYDISTKLSHGNAHPVSSLEELYALSDIVTYHVPETNLTSKMVNKEAISQMKDGVQIINHARGSIVDVEALVSGLTSGKVAGAAVDVFPTEPSGNNAELISPLREFQNVLLSPHVGGSTIEAQDNIGVEVASKLDNYANSGTTTGAVNFPEVSLPIHTTAHRIINIHRNIPGVLSEINNIFSSRGANIAGQSLQTKDDFGYVVTDIEQDEHLETYVNEIQALPASINTRLTN